MTGIISAAQSPPTPPDVIAFCDELAAELSAEPFVFARLCSMARDGYMKFGAWYGDWGPYDLSGG